MAGHNSPFHISTPHPIELREQSAEGAGKRFVRGGVLLPHRSSTGETTHDQSTHVRCLAVTSPTASPCPLRALLKWAFLLSLVCSLLTFAQLCAPCLWTWLTGEGVYHQPALAQLSLALFLGALMVSVAAPPKTIAELNRNGIIVWARRLASVAAAAILYPAIYHFYYDLPRYIFQIGGVTGLILCLATWMSLRWIVALNLFVSLAIASFLNVPHFLWDITDLRHTLNALNLLCAVAVIAPLTSSNARAGRDGTGGAAGRGLPAGLIDAVILLSALAFAIPYFYAGAGKVFLSSRTPWIIDGISWIWRERLEKFFEIFYYFGYTWLSPAFAPQTVASLLNSFWVRIPACSIVLLGELAMLSLFFSRRLFLMGLLCCQLLHIGFTFLAGTYFIHWFAWNIFLMVFWTDDQYRRLIGCLSIPQRLVALLIAVAAVPVVFHSSVLAWGTDRSTFDIYTWSVIPEYHLGSAAAPTETGEPLHVNPNSFFPYEKNFQMSWRFDRYFTGDTSQSDAPRKGDLWRGWCRWYKLRLVGEWHEALRRRIPVGELQVAVQKLLDRWIERKRLGKEPRFPYYTHIMANPAFFPPEETGTGDVLQYRFVLIKTRYGDRGVMRSERLAVTALLEASVARGSYR